ncbi:HD domain-containing protein [Actinomadura sp. GTD37]|uniref:HD domain-containing protein n=1 Tax=Actinomadura sp. GTD37 TaxID=1778030 RepID=UPI0035BF38AA
MPQRDDADDQGRPEPVDGRMIVRIVRDLAVPTLLVNRTSVMPFDRNRQENDAEHSFSLGLAAICIAPLVDPTLDTALVSKYSLVHDLPEIYAGDVSVYAQEEVRAGKARRETEAREQLAKNFGDLFPDLIATLDAYADQDDRESRFVYALDKLLPHAMVLIGDHHPVRPTWGEYKRTELRARKKIQAAFPELIGVFDDLCAEFAERPHFFSDGASGGEPR